MLRELYKTGLPVFSDKLDIHNTYTVETYNTHSLIFGRAIFHIRFNISLRVSNLK